jgi:hypothetical protein
MNEADISDLESEYEKNELTKFRKVVDTFQIERGFNRASMIRLIEVLLEEMKG